ncbi:MAG: TM7S3/TM198-like domain-containing protein [bacterium]
MTINWFPKIIAIALGLLITFWGYRLLKFTLVIAGLALGGYLGIFIANQAGAVSWLVAVSGILLGLVGALLTLWLFKLGVFLLGAAAGALLTAILSSGTGWQHLVILLVGALIGGILALLMQRPVISLLTGFLGAWWIVAGLFSLFGSTRVRLSDGYDLPIMAILWLAIGVAGFLVQMFKTGRKKQISKQ